MIENHNKNMIVVLDIDLDLFVDPRTEGSSLRCDERVISCESWEPIRVRKYLQAALGVTGAPIHGSHFFKTHDETLGVLSEMNSAVHLFHLDAHADLGIGQNCYRFHSEFMALKQRERRNRLQEFLPREGDFLLYAIACGFVDRLDYVTHPEVYRREPDIPIGMDQWDQKYERGQLCLKRFHGSQGDFGAREGIWSLERTIPMRMHCRDSFEQRTPFDCIFVTRSPRYTPDSSDRSFAMLRKMLER